VFLFRDPAVYLSQIYLTMTKKHAYDTGQKRITLQGRRMMSRMSLKFKRVGYRRTRKSTYYSLTAKNSDAGEGFLFGMGGDFGRLVLRMNLL
jgi:hypothetical protein